MIIGHLRHKLTVLAEQDGDADAFGAPVREFLSAGTVDAEVVHLSGVELQIAQQVNAQVTHRVTLRYLHGLTVQHRFQLGERSLEIFDINDVDERHICHICLCREAR
jgi:SPP1 family predicted phage head-tail adaptor